MSHRHLLTANRRPKMDRADAGLQDLDERMSWPVIQHDIRSRNSISVIPWVDQLVESWIRGQGRFLPPICCWPERRRSHWDSSQALYRSLFILRSWEVRITALGFPISACFAWKTRNTIAWLWLNECNHGPRTPKNIDSLVIILIKNLF